MAGFEDQAIYPGAELYLLRDFMQSYGILASQWLLGTGLSEEEITKVDTRLSIRQFDIIHRNIFRLLPDIADLGIRLGAALNLSRWGMLAGALLCSRTLGESLTIANKFRVLVRSRFRLQPQIEGDLCFIDIEPVGSDQPVSMVVALEILIATLQTQISQLLGQPYHFESINVSVSRPAQALSWQQHFTCPLVFGASRTRLVMDLNTLNAPLPLANPVARSQILAVCREDAERVASLRDGDRVWQVREWLSQQPSRVPACVAAKALGVSERTLRRQLNTLGSSYTALMEERCLQIAIQRLQMKGAKVGLVARDCGYRDTASFREIFRKHTGLSPREFLKRQ